MAKNGREMKAPPRDAQSRGTRAAQVKPRHGLAAPPKRLRPIERLRAVLKLSRRVPDEQVIAEAAERIERGVS